MRTHPTPSAAVTFPDALAAIPAVDLTVRSFGITDRGAVRESNQDQFLIAKMSRAIQLEQSSLSQPRTLFGGRHGHLFLVADGIGGNLGGEEASALAIVSIEDFVLNTLRWFFRLKGESILAEFQEALRVADARIFEEAARRPALKGMGTTVTMGYSNYEALYVVHVGDSRCYLWRPGSRLLQVTGDHTLVAEMVRSGAMSAEEAARSTIRNIITNAVGGPEPGIKAEVHRIPLQPGDVALFCTDGLHGLVSDDEIAAILAGEPQPEAACTRLVALANRNGGSDNITAIVARFDG